MTHYCKGMLVIAVILGGTVVAGVMSLNTLSGEIRSAPVSGDAEASHQPGHHQIATDLEAFQREMFSSSGI